jgi:hypothetical protein
VSKLHKALALIAPDWKVLERSKNCRTGLHEVRLANVEEPTRLIEGIGVTEGDAFVSVARKVLFKPPHGKGPTMKTRLAIATCMVALLSAPAFAGGIGKYNNPNAETHGHYRFNNADDRMVNLAIEEKRWLRDAGAYDEGRYGPSITNIGTVNNMNCSAATAGSIKEATGTSDNGNVIQNSSQFGNNSASATCIGITK